MTRPSKGSAIIAAKLMQPAHNALNAIDAGTFTGADLANLGMTARMRDRFHAAGNCMPTQPECLQTIMNDCTAALASGTPAVVYKDEVKRVRQWIEACRRQFGRIHLDRIEAVLNSIALTHMVKAEMHGQPVDDQFIEEELARVGFGQRGGIHDQAA